MYSQSPATSVTVGKPPRPPLGHTNSNPPMTVTNKMGAAANRPNKNKSVSSHDLLVQRQQEENDLMVQRSELGQSLAAAAAASQNNSQQNSDSDNNPPKILVASQQKSTTMPAGKANKSVSRSQTIPKDTRLAGWFKKRKRAN